MLWWRLGKIETVLGMIPREPLKSIVILEGMYTLEMTVPILSDMAVGPGEKEDA